MGLGARWDGFTEKMLLYHHPLVDYPPQREGTQAELAAKSRDRRSDVSGRGRPRDYRLRESHPMGVRVRLEFGLTFW